MAAFEVLANASLALSVVTADPDVRIVSRYAAGPAATFSA